VTHTQALIDANYCLAKYGREPVSEAEARMMGCRAVVSFCEREAADSRWQLEQTKGNK
jgi:tRNA G26 N,N-dimethylase Trm1